MKHIRSLLILLFPILTQLFQSGCSNPESSKVTDIIPNINVEFQTEREIVISDLLYSENYNVDLIDGSEIDVVGSEASVKLSSENYNIYKIK